MAIHCCSKCGYWNSCLTKWLRTEKGEENFCCISCFSYKDCLRKDIENLLQEKEKKISWLRQQIEEAMDYHPTKESTYGLSMRDFKAFVANYALTGFWILFGLETKLLEKSLLYILSIIPCLFVYWLILKKVQKNIASKSD